MLQDLPINVIIKLLSEVDLDTFAQLRTSTRSIWEHSQSDKVWEGRIQNDFNRKSLINYHQRVQEATLRREMLEYDEGSTATPEDLALASAQIPTAEQYYQYLQLAHLGNYIKSEMTVRYNGKNLNQEQTAVLNGLKNWYDARSNQDFSRIGQDLEQHFKPVMNLFKDPQLTLCFDSPAIHASLCLGYLQVTLMLIRQGSIPATFAGDLLVEAAKNDDLRVLSALLESGLDPNACQQNSEFNCTWRPLMSPALSNRMPAARLLLKYGADPMLGDARGYDNALKLAKTRENTEMVQLLEQAVTMRNFNALPF
jgi:hypothetical protein